MCYHDVVLTFVFNPLYIVIYYGKWLKTKGRDFCNGFIADKILKG